LRYGAKVKGLLIGKEKVLLFLSLEGRRGALVFLSGRREEETGETAKAIGDELGEEEAFLLAWAPCLLGKNTKRPGATTFHNVQV